ncbi:hypothetical protein Q4595_16405, partial [Wenyingzhuangia sp. 1_MG-2023]|nr:hypothetical protein [Wenyingzhuangia sp. 1_MG-2023]
MAGISSIACLAAPLERLLKELRAYQVSNSEQLVELIDDGAVFIASALQNKTDLYRNLTDAEQAYLQRIEQVEQSLLATLLQNDNTVIKTPNPQAISQFLANGMDALLEADLLLRQWQKSGDFSVLDALCRDLVEVADGAEQAEQPRIHELATSLHGFYLQASQSGEKTQAAEQNNWAELAMEGQEQLLNMMDCLAAGQALERPAILDRILGITHLLKAWAEDADAKAKVDESPFGEAPGDIPADDDMAVAPVTDTIQATTDLAAGADDVDQLSDHSVGSAWHQPTPENDTGEPVATLADAINTPFSSAGNAAPTTLDIEPVVTGSDDHRDFEDEPSFELAGDQSSIETAQVSAPEATQTVSEAELPLLSDEPFIPRQLDDSD